MPGRGIEIRFRALGGNTARFKRALADLEGETSDYIYDYLDKVKKKLEVYPPVPVGSDYVRTFTLQGAWTEPDVSNRTASGMRGFIYNNATDPRGRTYSSYVQGAWQTATHAATGWRKAEDYLDRPKYKVGLFRLYDRFARKANGR